MAKKLVILGGTGFLGYYTALAALKQGYEVASIAYPDIKLDGWFPKEVKVMEADLFKDDEEKLADLMKGYDYMIYSVGPDDRVTPKAPAKEFFYDRLVTYCAKCFRAAEKAGVKKAVVYNSYFTYFNDIYPKAHLAENHCYVAARIAQYKTLNEQKKAMEVVTLGLPYIFGAMPERIPLWRDVFLNRFAYGKKVIFFPKGSTSMIAVEHVGEAGVGALEYGKDGAFYPVADENHTYNWMLDTMMVAALGKKRKIMNPAGWVCGLGAKSIIHADKKKGLEPGLYYPKVMTDIMSKDMVIPQEKIDEVCTELHIGRGGLKESIEVMMDRCYPSHSFK
jgi:dihydroflavonol-4-reductase